MAEMNDGSLKYFQAICQLTYLVDMSATSVSPSLSYLLI